MALKIGGSIWLNETLVLYRKNQHYNIPTEKQRDIKPSSMIKQPVKKKWPPHGQVHDESPTTRDVNNVKIYGPVSSNIEVSGDVSCIDVDYVMLL